MRWFIPRRAEIADNERPIDAPQPFLRGNRLAFRSLRQRIIVLFVALLAVIQAVALVLVTSTSGQIARDASSDALLRGERIFQRLLRQNLTQL